jgi:hypothetical protein
MTNDIDDIMTAGPDDEATREPGLRPWNRRPHPPLPNAVTV